MVQGLLHGMELWTEWGWECVLAVSTQTPASGLRHPTSLGCWDYNLLETQRIGRPRPRPFQGGQSPTYNKGKPCPWEESEGPDPVWGHRTLACTVEQVLLPRLSFIHSPHWPGQSPSLSRWHLHTALPAWGLQGAETVPPDTYCLWVFKSSRFFSVQVRNTSHQLFLTCSRYVSMEQAMVTAALRSAHPTSRSQGLLGSHRRLPWSKPSGEKPE